MQQGLILWPSELKQFKTLEMFTLKLKTTAIYNNRNPLFSFFFVLKTQLYLANIGVWSQNRTEFAFAETFYIASGLYLCWPAQ